MNKRHRSTAPQPVAWRQIGCAGLALWLATAASSGWAQDALQVASGQTQLNVDVLGLEALGEGDQLAVELDGYDVTALASRRDGGLVLELQSPMGAGEHQLNVLVFYADGNIATLLEQAVSVHEGASLGEQSLAAGTGEGGGAAGGATAEAGAQSASQYRLDAMLGAAYRSDQRDAADYADLPLHTGNGGLSYQASGLQDAWEWSAELDTLYDSQSDNNPSEQQFELPHYRLSAARPSQLGKAGLRVGSVAIERDDLLFSSYQRRGLAASLGEVDNDRYRLDLFGLQSEPLSDYNRRLAYPGQSEERSSGGTVTLAGFSDQPDLLQLSLGYVEGETTDSGLGWVSQDEQSLYGGDSWNMALDGRPGDNSVWLHLEGSGARFDSDGLHAGEDYRSDHARQAQLQFNSGRWFGAGPFDQWSLSLQRREVGLDYFTLGNLSMPGDIQADQLGLQASLGGLQLEASLGRDRNNLDQRADIPDQTIHRQQVSLYYYPSVDAEALPWRVLGTPSLNAGWNTARRDQDADDAALAGYDLDDRTEEKLFGLGFYQNYWNWSLQQSYQDTNDRSQALQENGYLYYEPPSDQRNRMTSLQLGFTPLEVLSINASWQINRQQETDLDNQYDSDGYGLDIGWQLVPDTWQLSAAFYRGEDRSELGDMLFQGDEVIQQTASLQLTWSAFQPKAALPGLDLYVKASQAEQRSELYQLHQQDWQVLLGFDIAWEAYRD